MSSLRLASISALAISVAACVSPLQEAAETGTETGDGADTNADGEESADASSSEAGDGDSESDWTSGDGDGDGDSGDGDSGDGDSGDGDSGDGDSGDGDSGDGDSGDGDSGDGDSGDGDSGDGDSGDGDSGDGDSGDGDSGDGDLEPLEPFGGNGQSCGNAYEISVSSPGGYIDGNTQGGGSHQNTDGDCAFGEQNSPDRTYDVVFLDAGLVTVRTNPEFTDFNSVLYALSDCTDPDTNLACDGSSNGNGGDSFTISVGSGELIEMVVDGAQGDSGAYRLEFSYN